MNIEALTEIRRLHECWLRNEPEGKRADLRGADLRSANLEDADLEDANLRGANLEDADLEDANLRGADLRGANLRGADLEDANLRGANLRGADLEDANLDKIRISWTSHVLISEILWCAADTEPRQMLAAFIGRKTDWCWVEWAKYQHPERKWALGILRGYVTDGDNAPEVVRNEG